MIMLLRHRFFIYSAGSLLQSKDYVFLQFSKILSNYLFSVLKYHFGPILSLKNSNLINLGISQSIIAASFKNITMKYSWYTIAY